MKNFYRTITPILLCLLTGLSLVAQQSKPIYFEWGTERFPENIQLANQMQYAEDVAFENGYTMRYIQCAQIPDANLRASLEQQGVRFYSYVHDGAYLVGLPDGFSWSDLAKIGTRSIVAVKPEWKMARSLREKPWGDWAVRGDHVDINIQSYPHISIAESAEKCRELGFRVVEEGNQNGFLHLRIPENRLMELAARPFVKYMELVDAPSVPDDTKGRAMHRSSLLDSDSELGRRFNGEGVNIMVRDDGQVGPHIDFQGRLINDYAKTDPLLGDHGDGVGGVFSGAGNLDPEVKGMAPGALIYVVDYQADFQGPTLPLHKEKGVTITNTSYSNGCNLGYTLAAQTVDQQLFENKTLMHVFSAGNANNTDCGYGAGNQWGNITGGHKASKNSIATANLYADITIVESSSRGPMNDGRLKPEIAAHGQNQASAAPNNTNISFGGTSAAAPGIAGCLTQLTHAYKSLNNNELPNATLLKACILNTANDLGNAGPDFKFGYGHVNTWRAFRTLELGRYKESSVDAGKETTFTITVPNLTEQARFMIVWADPPAEELAKTALVNDLDLTVTGPNGTVNLPWLLDPTPDVTNLDAPATRGRDSLNNHEQVVIDKPAAGTYTIKVKGTAVPFGPQAFFLVWEFHDDRLKIVYPDGGQSLVPGTKERVFWDAHGNTGNFTLRYSLDNGATFLPVTQVTGEKRWFDWTVPTTVSSQVRFFITRGTRRDTSDFPMSIVNVPEALRVAKVCPDSITFAWKSVADSIGATIYMLGEKYMEGVGTSAPGDSSLTIKLKGSPLNSFWYAIGASRKDGLKGRRTNARNYAGGLLNCPQQTDAFAQALLGPGTDITAFCDNNAKPIKIRIANSGKLPLNGATVSYQINNENAVTEPLPDINVGAFTDYTFTTLPNLPNAGSVELKIWVSATGDIATYNDTLRATMPILSSAFSTEFKEDFEAQNTLPKGWAITNPDNKTSWQLSDGLNLIGKDDKPTRALYMNNYEYNGLGEKDMAYLGPIDLQSISDPALIFDYAYARFTTATNDSLVIEAFTDCNTAAQPDVIWKQGGTGLSTLGKNLTDKFVPDSAYKWRSETVGLNKYAGKKLLLRFRAVNDNGNNLYIDNIGIKTFIITKPTAAINAATDTLCRAVAFSISVLKPEPATTYTWSLGSGSSIGATATGVGPLNYNYTIPGTKNIRLIASNSAGNDTAFFKVVVLNQPSANFSSLPPSGLTVKFVNSSANATSYLWDFGDGQSSTEKEPTHTFPGPGTYQVRLSSINQCSTAVRTNTISLTSNVRDLEGRVGVQILPNPTAGDFAVLMNSKINASALVSLLDAAGKLITTQTTQLKTEQQSTLTFQNLNLPKGLYQLKVQTEDGLQSFGVVVQ